MTKFVKTLSVLALVLTLGACATGAAQQESITKGDSTFSGAQSK
jgi:Flp pilus assembly protein TadD